MKKKLLLIPVLGMLLAGCSMDDLMFWKKKDSGNQDQQKEDEGEGGGDSGKTYDYNPTVTGGTKEEQTAILEALNNRTMCTLNGKSSQEIFPYPDSYMTLKEDNGDGIKLTTSQAMPGNLTVSIEWAIDETQTYYGGRKVSDAAHDIVDINYQHYGVADGTFEWKIDKMTCGGAKAENANILFKAKTMNEEYRHTDYKIAELYHFNDEPKTVHNDKTGADYHFPSTMDIIDYEYHAEYDRYYPSFKTNNPEAQTNRFLYVNVPGKVVYLAPDGNWGLLADGENAINFFAGKSGTALTPRNWPNLAVGNYVTISATVDQYQGNVQLTFVTKIKEAKASDLDAEPSLQYHELTDAKIALLETEGYTCQKHNVMIDDAHMFNSLRKVTGTYVEDSLTVKSGDEFEKAEIEDISSSLRFMFKLEVGGKEMDVAYDYHTDQDGSHNVYNKLQAKLMSGGEMTISGCMRYFGNDLDAFITEGNNGVWSIVPFVSENIA